MKDDNSPYSDFISFKEDMRKKCSLLINNKINLSNDLIETINKNKTYSRSEEEIKRVYNCVEIDSIENKGHLRVDEFNTHTILLNIMDPPNIWVVITTYFNFLERINTKWI